MASLSFVTSGQRETVNDIMEAIGSGRPYERKFCPANVANPTYQTPATHFGSLHMGATSQEEQVLSDMVAGNLPELSAGQEWGENGLPTEQAALAAIGSGNMRHFTAGGWTPEEEVAERDLWMMECLSVAFGGGLQLVPDEPL